MSIANQYARILTLRNPLCKLHKIKKDDWKRRGERHDVGTQNFRVLFRR